MSNAAHHDQDDFRLLRQSVRTLLERAGGVARARKIRDEGGGWDAPFVPLPAEVSAPASATPAADPNESVPPGMMLDDKTDAR